MLKLCVDSTRQNLTFQHQIVLHINEGADGTQKWANTEGGTYTASATNIGICQAINLAFGNCKNEYIMYLNDDMYVLPEWDKHLIEEIKKIGNHPFMLSATMIEPRETRAENIIVADYGHDVAIFQKEKLLAEYSSYPMPNWSGAS